MNPEDDASNWKDGAGESPDLTVDWTWDMDSLEIGEYVGYPLYQQCRARIKNTYVPEHAINRVILHMIDMHDAELVSAGVGCATLVTKRPEAGQLINFVKILEARFIPPMEKVTSWKDMLASKLSGTDVNFDHLFDDDTDADENAQQK